VIFGNAYHPAADKRICDARKMKLMTFKRKIFEVYYRLFDIVQFMFEPSMAYNAICNKEEMIEAIFVKGIM